MIGYICDDILPMCGGRFAKMPTSRSIVNELTNNFTNFAAHFDKRLYEFNHIKQKGYV